MYYAKSYRPDVNSCICRLVSAFLEQRLHKCLLEETIYLRLYMNGK